MRLPAALMLRVPLAAGHRGIRQADCGKDSRAERAKTEQHRKNAAHNSPLEPAGHQDQSKANASRNSSTIRSSCGLPLQQRFLRLQ